jgi:hypothetical protein
MAPGNDRPISPLYRRRRRKRKRATETRKRSERAREPSRARTTTDRSSPHRGIAGESGQTDGWTDERTDPSMILGPRNVANDSGSSTHGRDRLRGLGRRASDDAHARRRGDLGAVATALLAATQGSSLAATQRDPPSWLRNVRTKAAS